MPAITSGKVLVTGANGYIASWVVSSLLQQGFSVRGTVRSEAKGAHLKEVFKTYGDKLEVVVVEDITKAGAFDEFVKDVDAIEHTASPFHFNAVDPSELIIPAVAGTTSVLASAATYGQNVKRVIVLSSCAAVLHPGREPHTFSEEDWNLHSIAEVETKGKDAGNPAKYRASKTLAEKAAWEFYDKSKASISWDLVVLNPPFVFGPILHGVDSLTSLNTSALDWFKTVLEGSKDDKTLVTFGSSWVDVRDVAQAHVLALTKQEASGNRIIISAGPFVWQDWINVARKLYPGAGIPAGNQSFDASNFVYPVRYDTSKATRLLGLNYRTQEELARDSIETFKEKGWWGKK